MRCVSSHYHCCLCDSVAALFSGMQILRGGKPRRCYSKPNDAIAKLFLCSSIVCDSPRFDGFLSPSHAGLFRAMLFRANAFLRQAVPLPNSAVLFLCAAPRIKSVAVQFHAFPCLGLSVLRHASLNLRIPRHASPLRCNTMPSKSQARLRYASTFPCDAWPFRCHATPRLSVATHCFT